MEIVTLIDCDPTQLVQSCKVNAFCCFISLLEIIEINIYLLSCGKISNFFCQNLAETHLREEDSQQKEKLKTV